jgi:hypothetical protein
MASPKGPALHLSHLTYLTSLPHPPYLALFGR